MVMSFAVNKGALWGQSRGPGLGWVNLRYRSSEVAPGAWGLSFAHARMGEVRREARGCRRELGIKIATCTCLGGTVRGSRNLGPLRVGTLRLCSPSLCGPTLLAGESALPVGWPGMLCWAWDLLIWLRPRHMPTETTLLSYFVGRETGSEQKLP